MGHSKSIRGIGVGGVRSSACTDLGIILTATAFDRKEHRPQEVSQRIIWTQISICQRLLLAHTHHALPPINLHPPILPRTHNPHTLVPTHPKHLHPLTSHPPPLPLDALPFNDKQTLPDPTILLALRRPDVPNPACPVVTPTD